MLLYRIQLLNQRWLCINFSYTSARRGGASITMNNYARLSDGSVVFIHGYENGIFSTVRIDRDEEAQHQPCELTPWGPAPGESLTPEGEPVWV